MSLEDKIQRFAIISAQACATVNKQVLTSILTYIKHKNAELKILPMQGKHINEDRMAKILHQYELIYGDLNLNSKIKIKDYKVTTSYTSIDGLGASSKRR